MLDLGQGPIREFQLGGRNDLVSAFEPFLRAIADIREIQMSDKIEIGTDTLPFTIAGLPGINLDQDSPDYKYTNHSAADALEAVKPDVLAQDATIVGLTAFWIADRPQRLASPWPPERTAKMLRDKGECDTLKAFGLWSFGDLGAEPGSSYNQLIISSLACGPGSPPRPSPALSGGRGRDPRRAARGPLSPFPQLFLLPCGESCLTELSAFSILYVLSGVFHPSNEAIPLFGDGGWKGILQSRNKLDGMGQKSGRNGAPAPKSRVSLSDSEPRAERLPLGVRAESLAGISGFAVHLSAPVCALAFLYARKVRVRKFVCALGRVLSHSFEVLSQQAAPLNL